MTRTFSAAVPVFRRSTTIDMKTLMIVVIAMLMVAAWTAHARLGESFDEVTARYGTGSVLTATNDDSFIALFQHDDFKIAVKFWKGKDADESISKFVGGSEAVIFQDDATALFKTVSDGGKIVVNPSGRSVLYTNKSTGATGMLLAGGLTVHARDYMDHVMKSSEVSIKGF